MAANKKKSEKRQRTNLKAFRLSDMELAQFMENCEASNLNGGDFFRTRCCNEKPLRRKPARRPDTKLLAKILAHIMKNQNRMARLDNNVNQIAHAVNVARMNINERQLASILERHAETLEKLIELYQSYIRSSNENREMLRQTLKR